MNIIQIYMPNAGTMSYAAATESPECTLQRSDYTAAAAAAAHMKTLKTVGNKIFAC